MMLKVLYFSTLRRVTNTREETIELPDGARIGDLLAVLRERHPPIQQYLPSLLIAKNQEYAANGETLQDGDEVALMPPVSGG